MTSYGFTIFSLENAIDSFLVSAFQTKNLPKPDLAMPSEDSTCAICDDSEGENSNAIVFCDGCNLAVHQGKFMVYYHFTKVEHAARLLWCALHPRGSMALSEMYGFP